MIIKVNYTVSDIYMSTSVSPVYIKVVYSGTSNAGGSGTVTSVGLTMPSAFSVANSPITSSGTLAVTASGTASQYIRGDGQLATLPSNGSGGSSIAYYLNGSVNQGTIGGSVYYEMNKTPIIGAGTDFSIAGNGLISQFITDVADPNRLQIPAGNWTFEMYMSASSPGGTPRFYLELLKYDGTTFTSIASSSATPEGITNGTTIDLYVTALAVPLTTLLATDRLALRVYIVNSAGGRTITMHTENSHLCEIITNFPGGVSALNGLTANTQYLAVGTSGTDFGISSSDDTHTFNLPTASATNRGALTASDWNTFNGKQNALGFTPVPTSRTITINGTTLDLSVDRTFTIDLSAYVPYTGATGAVSLGTNGLSAGTITLQQQALNSSTYKITQQMATNDYWSIYGFATIADEGDLFFELQDNAAFVNGQRFRFRYGNDSSGVPKDILLMDYNGATIDGTLVVNSSITGNSFIKSGGTSAQLLAADGSVVTAGTNITISGGTISASGGGGSLDELQVALLSQVFG
jgi:hypothetical protein